MRGKPLGPGGSGGRFLLRRRRILRTGYSPRRAKIILTGEIRLIIIFFSENDFFGRAFNIETCESKRQCAVSLETSFGLNKMQSRL